jgi:hypothetical protein
VTLTDTARFAVDDPEPIVLAAFVCPICLERPTSALFSLDEPNESAVVCDCGDCRTNWVVAVNPGQAMRLAIAPPDELHLQAA